MKEEGPGEFHEIDRWSGGVGWLAHPDEAMQRASHALVVDGEVWLVDPVDAAGLDERLADLGEVAGVVVLLDRHERDSAAIARRHGVPVVLPSFMRDLADALDAPTEVASDELGDTGYAIHEVANNRFWQEAALYDGETLVVPESLGTVAYTTTGEERLGVHPMRRLVPPRSLGRLAVERVLVGHGAGVLEDADRALRRAVGGSVRRTPRLYAGIVRDAVFG